jgi:hypothetical protein
MMIVVARAAGRSHPKKEESADLTIRGFSESFGVPPYCFGVTSR